MFGNFLDAITNQLKMGISIADDTSFWPMQPRSQQPTINQIYAR